MAGAEEMQGANPRSTAPNPSLYRLTFMSRLHKVPLPFLPLNSVIQPHIWYYCNSLSLIEFEKDFCCLHLKMFYMVKYIYIFTRSCYIKEGSIKLFIELTLVLNPNLSFPNYET